MNLEELKTKLKEIDSKLIGTEETTETRIFLSCEVENGFDVCKFVFEQAGCRFVIATAIDSDDCFEVLYHFTYDQLGAFVTVKVFIRDRENPSVESITPIVIGAEWIEREMHDLFGIDFKNHPRLERLILSDDWPEGVYPMRKEVKQ